MFSWVAREMRIVEVPLSWRGWCRAGLAAQDVRIYQLRLMTISIHSSLRILNLKDGQFSRNKKQGEWTYVYIYIHVFFFSLLIPWSDMNQAEENIISCDVHSVSTAQVHRLCLQVPLHLGPFGPDDQGNYREIVDRERPTEFLQHNLSLWSPWKRFWSEFFETIILRSTSWCIISYDFVRFHSKLQCGKEARKMAPGRTGHWGVFTGHPMRGGHRGASLGYNFLRRLRSSKEPKQGRGVSVEKWNV